jgi:hypothetical protein
MNITTGVASRPQNPCTNGTTGLCCSLNGILQANATCLCDPGWRGIDCGELDLSPAPSIDGAFQTVVDPADCAVSCGPSSWGGLPLRDADGTWHLFASMFVQNCTLSGKTVRCTRATIPSRVTAPNAFYLSVCCRHVRVGVSFTRTCLAAHCALCPDHSRLIICFVGARPVFC